MAAREEYSLKWLFFSFNGRIRRLTYFLSAVLIVTLYSYILVQVVRTPETSWQFGAWGLVIMVTLLLTAWWGAALSAKRLHDMGYSGYLAVAMFIPMLAMVFFIVLCAWEGQKGRNQFGEPPVNGR